MAGKPVERSFSDILTSIRYWVIHSITIPALVISRWLCITIPESSTDPGLPENVIDDYSVDELDEFTSTFTETEEDLTFTYR